MLRLEHQFECDAKGITYFALTYPFSYSDCQKYLDNYEKIYSDHSQIYFHRELLGTTLEGRRLDLLTITGRNAETEEREEYIPELFPDSRCRPLKFKKPTIFVIARVHPGETQGSHMVNGLLSYLLGKYFIIFSHRGEKNQRAKEQRVISNQVLSKFVFKIIPMMNPDGVYKGFFRLDTLGQNLNRYYNNPSLVHSLYT